MKLNKNKIYDLSELTSEEWKQLTNSEKCAMCYYEYVEGIGWVFKSNESFTKEVVNAKELFYTLENVQVDCSELTEEQIKEMADVYKNNGFIIGTLNIVANYKYLNDANNNYCVVNKYLKSKTTITYEKFMELFGDKEKSEEFNNLVEVLNEELTEEAYKETYNKLSYELDFNFITQLAERMAQNKHKYEPYNWQKLDNITELKQALFRHVLEVMNGNYEDDGRMFAHLESIALNAMFINYQLKKKH
ncbi:MAG: hypothetical protein [Caudoviricetes sp.]|nr:MAG: hypothetical protein [Caudoviricetes sp.]